MNLTRVSTTSLQYVARCECYILISSRCSGTGDVKTGEVCPPKWRVSSAQSRSKSYSAHIPAGGQKPPHEAVQLCCTEACYLCREGGEERGEEGGG